MRRLIWATAVWGQRYIEYLRSVHVPSLLAAGNFPALGAPIDSVVYVAPPEAEDVAQIVEPMAQFGAVKVLRIEDWPHPRARRAMAWAMADAVRRAWESDAGLLYTYPDTILSNGSYATVARLIAGGARACLGQGISAKARPILRAARAWRVDSPPAVAVSGLELATLVVANLHPVAESYIWGAKNFTPTPAMIHWPVPGGYLMHTFHLHPVFVYPRRLGDAFRWTLDGDYMDHAGLSADEIAYLDDGTEFLMVELVHPAQKLDMLALPNTATPEGVAEYAKENVTPLNLDFFARRITIAGPKGTAAPEVDATVAAILDAIRSQKQS